jgi:hypothetical protein
MRFRKKRLSERMNEMGDLYSDQLDLTYRREVE